MVSRAIISSASVSIARRLILVSTALGATVAAAESTLVASVQRAIASSPGVFTTPTFDEVWANVDVWAKQQRAEANARLERGHARFLPPHLRSQNALARYAENELLLLPQRDDRAALRAGTFTIGRPAEVGFAGRDDSPESSLGVIVEFEGELAFAGDLPEAGARVRAQAKNLGELIHAVVPASPTKITLVPRAGGVDQHVNEVRRALGERYAGVRIEVRPEWR